VVHWQLLAAPLVVRRSYLIVAPKQSPVAPSMYLIVAPRPEPAAPLSVCGRYLAVAPGPLPTAPRRPLQFAKAGSAATLSQQEEQLGESSAGRRYLSR